MIVNMVSHLVVLNKTTEAWTFSLQPSEATVVSRTRLEPSKCSIFSRSLCHSEL